MNLIPSGRAAGGPTRDDAGVSLVELLISMILVSVLGTMIVTTFIQGANAAYDSDARTADTQQAKILTENTSRMLRLAVDPDGTGALTPFEVATPDEVVFYAADGNRSGAPSADTPPSKVRIYRDGDVLKMNVKTAVVVGATTSWPGTGNTRTIGTGVANGSLPMFTYLAAGDIGVDADGVAVTSLDNVDGTLASGALGDVEAVEIWVKVATKSTTRSIGTTAVTRVTLLNQ
ncbi:MAG: hypothetical protein GXX79_05990 [Actinomycetales bacterium]|nr:hypothetical protein [Actinomycetales bacterium]